VIAFASGKPVVAAYLHAIVGSNVAPLLQTLSEVMCWCAEFRVVQLQLSLFDLRLEIIAFGFRVPTVFKEAGTNVIVACIGVAIDTNSRGGNVLAA
jgi:hypothetical protein